MATRRFIHPIATASIIIAFCAALITGALADSKSDSQRDRKPDKGPAAEHRVNTRDGKDGGRSNSGNDRRPGPDVRREDDRSRGRTEWHVDTNKGRWDRRDQDRRPGTNPHPSDNSWNRRPGSGNWNRTPDSTWDRDRHPSNTQPHYYPSKPGGYHPPAYSHKPHRYNYWVVGRYEPNTCRRSVYFHFGFLPYISLSRVHVVSYVVSGYRGAAISLNDDYYLSRQIASGLEGALADIRRAWTDGRLDLIQNHVRASQSIAVLLDGRYDYTIESGDYIDMTADAMDDMETVSFTWEKVRERTNGDYTAMARHVFYDDDGYIRTVYVTYNLRRYAGGYVITEVGSSTSPIFWSESSGVERLGEPHPRPLS